MLKNRRAINLLGAAVLLLLLGSGNIIYGRHKHQEYQKLLSEAQSGLTSPQSLPLPVPGPTVTIDQHMQRLKRLKARVDLYAFVVTGGNLILVVAAILLAFSLGAFRQEK